MKSVCECNSIDADAFSSRHCLLNDAEGCDSVSYHRHDLINAGTINVPLIEQQRRERAGRETKVIEEEARKRLASIDEDLKSLELQEKELLEQLAAIEGLKNEIAQQVSNSELETGVV